MQDRRSEIALVFVGAIVPEKPGFVTPAFSRAGQIYQRELLAGLRLAGIATTKIISIVPMPSFPKSGQLWVAGSNEEIIKGVPARLLPFLNVTPFKQLIIGMGTIIELARWGWRHRHSQHRVVYTYNLTVPPGLFTYMGAKLIRAQTVVSLCDIDVPGHTVPSSLGWRINFWVQRKLIPLFDGHVVAADAIARDFLLAGPFLRLDGGMSNEFLASLVAAKAIEKPNRGLFVVGFAGRLDETNGIPTLLRAFSLLEGHQFRLFLAGSGPLEEEVKRAADKDNRIAFWGLCPIQKVAELYTTSDVLVNMRMTQQVKTEYFFPSKLLEYLASGTPVITTCTGHAAVEFGEFVYLLQNESAEGLAVLIRKVANEDPQVRGRMGRRARDFMIENKTWDAQARRVAEFIRNLVSDIDRQVGPSQDSAQKIAPAHERH